MIQDLIYAGEEAIAIARKYFPDAKIENASDEIHTERFSIEVNLSEEEYYFQLMKSGLILESLSFGLENRMDIGDKNTPLRRAFERFKAEKKKSNANINQGISE